MTPNNKIIDAGLVFVLSLCLFNTVLLAQEENLSIMSGGMGNELEIIRLSEDNIESWRRNLERDINKTTISTDVELCDREPTEEEKKALPVREWGDFVDGQSLTIWSDKTVYGFAEPIIIYGQVRYEKDFDAIFPKSQDLCVRYKVEVTYSDSFQVPLLQHSPQRIFVTPTDYSIRASTVMGHAGAKRNAGYVGPIHASFLNRHYDMSLAGIYHVRIRRHGNSSKTDPENEAYSNELKLKIVNKPSEGEICTIKSYPKNWALRPQETLPSPVHPMEIPMGTPLFSQSPEELNQAMRAALLELTIKQKALTFGEKWVMIDTMLHSLTLSEKMYIIDVVKQTIGFEEHMKQYKPMSQEEQVKKSKERKQEFERELEKYEIDEPNFIRGEPPMNLIPGQFRRRSEIKPPPDQEWGKPVHGESISIWSDKTVYGFAEPIIIYAQTRHDADAMIHEPNANLCYCFVPIVKFQDSRSTDNIHFSVFPTDYKEDPGWKHISPKFRTGEISHATYTYLNRSFDMTREGTYFIRVCQKRRILTENQSEGAESNELKIMIIDAPSTTSIPNSNVEE